MTPDIPYIKEKFRKFNQLFFKSSLPEIPVRLSTARTYHGLLQCKMRRNLSGKVEAYDYVLCVSTRYDLPEVEVDDTIIHEMIHYYILYHRIHDDAPHGHQFVGIMNRINAEYGRHVTIRHKIGDECHQRDTEVRQHLICVTEFANGKRGITISTRTRLFQLWNEIPQLSGVVSVRWYISTDPYFNRYPRSSSLKVYTIPQDELEDHLQSAKSLKKIGDTIRVMS